MTEPTKPRTKFDWAIYADATFAGLSVLIPVPLVDLLFETIFKRRMARTIVKRNGRILDKAINREFNKWRFGCWPGCLVWPVMLVLEFLKRLYRTVLYFLTVKSASDRLSYYWHRAFLLDYMTRRGDLDDLGKGHMAVEALEQVLGEITTSPLIQLAQQIIGGVSHIFSTLWGWIRRKKEDEVVTGTREQMERSWADFGAYFEEVALQYDLKYAEIEAVRMGESDIILHATEAIAEEE
ncbi:MAG: hypothetical protein GY943_01715 [Chloroflexi bacterium]|nr:hypothetical protein [Chloroflexota bacterium]